MILSGQPARPSPKQVADARRRRINREAALARLAERDRADEHVDTVSVPLYSSGGAA